MIPSPSDDQPPLPRRRYQFRLSTLFLLMLMVSVLAAAVGGLVRSSIQVDVPGEVYLAMLAAAPLGVMIVLSLYHALVRWCARRSAQDDQEPPEPR